MTPQSHFLTSWIIANREKQFRKCEYWLVIGSGLFPDIDGFGYPFEYFTRGTKCELNWYTQYHHLLLHGILGFAIVAAVSYLICRRTKIVSLCLFAFSLHLVCDLIGSGGPENENWPLILFWPISNVEFTVSWQWPLSSFYNTTIVFVFEIVMIVLLIRRKYSPISLISESWDKRVLGIFKIT